MNHKLNVVISRTPTILGKIIRFLAGGYYNHCAIALDDDLSNVYAFARRNKYLWFTGCFCKEPVENYLDYLVYDLYITDEQYDKIKRRIKLLSRKYYIYNYPAIVLIYFNKPFSITNHYICSTFVTSILEDLGLPLEKKSSLYTPMDVKLFLDNYISSLDK